jgi:peptide deformylase
MPVRTILQLGDPALRETSSAIENSRSPEVKDLITDLGDTLTDFRDRHGFGRGIAAPQIGVAQRVIFIRMPDGSFDGPLINPEIVDRSAAMVELWDSCFSLPGVLVRVRRAARIRVEYIDADNNLQSVTADGDFAELLQHEIDHLDGILIPQRAVSTDAFIMRPEWERQGRPK